jgi:type I restriction enzyme S subunit
MKLAACQRFSSDIVPPGWDVQPLRNRLRLEYGSALTDADRRVGQYEVFGSNGKVGTHNSYLVDGPGILVGRKGSVGEVHFSDENFWPIDTVYFVRRLREDDWHYLYYLLSYLRLDQMNAATGVPGLTRRDAHFILGAFPGVVEQRRIAAILKLADQAIARAQEKLARARRLKVALMQQLFKRGVQGSHCRFKKSVLGDIPESWNVVSIGSVLDGMPFNGISPQSRPDPPGTPILNVECIDEGRCSVEKVTYVAISGSRG